MTHLSYCRRQRQSSKIINQVVEEKTNGVIKNIFPDGSIEGTTKLILINAIHFKGTWENEFEPNFSTMETFYLADGTTIQTSMMRTTAIFQSSNIYDLKAVALKMPYKGNRMSMIIILPNKNTGKFFV